MALRRPLTRFITRTTSATTSRRWIRPPPTCMLKPRSHKIARTTKTVQSILFSSGTHDSASDAELRLLPCVQVCPEPKSSSCRCERPLHRDIDRNSHGGVSAVVQVVAVVDVGHVNIVGVVPVTRPVLRPWVNRAEPVALVLEARIATHHQKGQAVKAETMIWAKVSSITVVGNAIAVVSTSLLPIAVV